MIQNAGNGNGNSPDVIVVGAGIFGLWAARHAIKRGQRVLVLEKRRVGEGASGGFLGALMPHMPDRWNAKKQWQYDALTSLADAIGEVQSDTGLDCGYRQCGRLMPLVHEKMPEIASARIAGAKAHWVDGAGQQAYRMELLAPDFSGTVAENWLSEKAAPYGAVHDTLSARVDPRAYLGALAHYVRSPGHGLGEIREGCEVASFREEQSGVSVTLSSGETISGGQLVIASGWEVYDLLAKAGASFNGNRVTGQGVKGQAVLLEFKHGDNRPIVYDNGSYVVPHAGNRIAIGSTSIDDWQPPANRFDEADMRFYEHALELCPQLTNAPITERWANVRPRNTMPDPGTGRPGTEPVFGKLDGHNHVKVAVGGFKISLGIGHVKWW